MSIGTQLRAIRVASGYNQAELAEKIESGQSTISEVERDLRPTTTDVIERWAAACNAVIEIRRLNEASQVDQMVAMLTSLDDKRRSWALRALELAKWSEEDDWEGLRHLWQRREARAQPA